MRVIESGFRKNVEDRRPPSPPWEIPQVAARVAVEQVATQVPTVEEVFELRGAA